jgi:plasmid maintenance system antidote protein VapI
MAMSQAIALLSDQKLAHYMHVSPKNVSDLCDGL